MSKVIILLIFVLSYLFGSLPTAYLVGKYFAGIDIRKTGSGNVGSTNALRSVGIKGAAIVFVIDVFKGFLPAWMGLYFGGELLGFALGLIAIIGHIYPVWLDFNGGKGVATTFGMLLAIVPTTAIFGIAAFAIVVIITGLVSLGSVLAAISIPITIYSVYHDITLFLLSIPLVLLVIYKHRNNIKRILARQENNIYSRKTG